MAGYSGTPLAKKLGIKPASRIFVTDAPEDYDELLAPMPEGVKRARKLDASVELLHVFETGRQRLGKMLVQARKTLGPDAVVWVSWPKKASGVATDITEDTIREVALPTGLVDIKVCAVDEIWSGLKLVIRKEQR